MVELEFEVINSSAEEHAVLLYGVTKEGLRVIARDESMPLYFLVLTDETVDVEALIFQINSLIAREGKIECSVVKTEKIEHKLLGEKKTFLKVLVNNSKALNVISSMVKRLEGVVRTYEKEVNHAKKYLFDNKITPLTSVSVKGEKLIPPPGIDYYIEVEEISSVESDSVKHNILCFDIETYNPNGVSEVSSDPVVMISYASTKGSRGVLTWKKTGRKFAKVLSNEKEMIKEFVKIINSEKPSFLVSYNGDNFDLPYLKERAKINKAVFKLGWDGSSVKFKNRGVRGSSATITGLVNIDLYPFIATSMGTYLKTDTYTLNAVCEELLGECKEDFDIMLLKEFWDKGDIDKLLDYSLRDAEITLKLADKVLPLLFELTRIVGVLPEYVCRSGFSSIVENYLMKETRYFNEVILRKPSREELTLRFRQTYKGGFVFEPVPGFYENIAVFDFRSLYPSIIVAHNICPTTLNAKGRDVHVSPEILVNNQEVSFRFAKSPKGFIPTLIKDLIERRANVKSILKKIDKSDDDYSILSARQNAIKILANATYGYLGFPQARWYSLECAASITAWGRQYINNVIKRAEIAGLKVLYGDTDSCFFILPKPDVNSAMEFVAKVNKNLPEMMELQFEGFFKTGLFVSKKGQSTGAKKKYALCNDRNELTVKGFELVRRDWSIIAKELQENILKKVLTEKDFKGALKLLQEKINDVKNNKPPVEEFVITTRMTKDVKSYDSLGPHVSAAMKAKKNGKSITSGMLINYVIVKGKGSISERSYLIDDVVEKGLIPDSDYYIEHQLIPSVEEILKVVGFKEEDIIKKEQKTLEGFM
ncbi:MAG: ribonuclease H-like domain-containing protein [Nanoarchaeota archaeon]|nr:ribonuclease H-like domain-containing protein [Nanoarchaeota archaeon]